jgi:hypothetical protein
MAQSAGYDTTLKVGGSSTTLTNAACTKITANTVYRITNASQRVLDPDVAVVVESDPLANGTWGVIAATVDYFTGTVTVAAQLVTALVRVSGAYIPLYTIAFARSSDFNLTVDELDVTVYGDEWREFIMGMVRGELSFEVVSDAEDDLDGGGRTLQAIMDTRDTTFIEFQPGGQGRYFRFWAFLRSVARQAPVDGLLTSSLQAVLSTRAPAAPFSSSTIASS